MRIGKTVVPPLISGLLMMGLTACGGGSGSSSTSTMTQTGTMPVVISDASSEDWATIGVKIQSIALTPQGGGAAVTVYSSSTPAMLNLAQLDQIGEILGNVTIPVGTYTGAVLTISGNPGDVALTVSADPEAGFAGTAGQSIDNSQIQIQHTKGSTGSLTTAVNVNFVAPLVVTTGQNNALDLEFDLSHPAFIVAHVPPTNAGNTLWAVNFNGPVRHHPISDIRHLVLRHTYGNVTSVAADNTSITIMKDQPTRPIVNPETATATSQSLQILADATNGTLFYDVDAKTRTTIMDFSALASNLDGKYVRVAARYQQNGTLVATRIWASSQFNSVWISPEGHVLYVNTANNIIDVTSESGGVVPLTIDSNTEFFFRTPQNALADATPIATGTAFLSSQNLVRGFKVHASVVDPLATPLVAQTIDIETAAYDGTISNANSINFTYTRKFNTPKDDYAFVMDYIDGATANGKDANGNAIVGFKYWDFAYPTIVTSGANAVTNFEAVVNGSVNFGGVFGSVTAYGVSYAVWGDTANPTGWSAPWTVLEPTPLPLGTVTVGYANNSFSMSVPTGAQAATIDISTTSGSATLVYQVDRTGGVVTISSEDITTTAGLTAMTNGLASGAKVKVYGVPQFDGTFKAYVLTYYTGMATTM